LKRQLICASFFPSEQEHAVTTFNWLNSERRYVAGAFLPPKTVQYTEDDVFKMVHDRAANRDEDYLAKTPENMLPLGRLKPIF
jgi:hypothetical protein